MMLVACDASGGDHVPYEQGAAIMAEPTPSPTTSQTPTTIQEPNPTPEVLQQDDQVPFMWQVTAPNGQTMYIFGAIHAAPAELYPLSQTIMDAFYRSDYLAVEVWETESSFSPVDVYAYTGGRTLVDDISAELHQRLTEALAENQIPFSFSYFGVSLESLDDFMPMMWSSVLAQIAVEKSGLSLRYGLDSYFIGQALDRGMDILSIEGSLQQIETLLGLSLPLQTHMVEIALNSVSNAEAVKRGYEIWRKGDDEGMIAALFEGFTDDGLVEEAFDALFRKRNLHMADMVSFFMAEGKKVFYVVGADHLLGEESVISLLVERGYEVERIR